MGLTTQFGSARSLCTRLKSQLSWPQCYLRHCSWACIPTVNPWDVSRSP